MGDLRNKIAKIERAKRDRADLESFLRARGWKPKPPSPPENVFALVCRGCLHNHGEKPIYPCKRGYWDPVEYWCLGCMPVELLIEAGAASPEMLENIRRDIENPAMCNLYSVTKGQKAIIELVKAMRDLTGNMPSLPAIFPNRYAPIVRVAPDGVRELRMARWGFPPPVIPGKKPRNPYLTNVRNTDSRYWRTYLKPTANRCLVPVTSFAEPDNRSGDDKPSIWTWFAQDESRPLMFFAGIWREWEGDRGTKTVPDLGKHTVFSFLTTDASPDVAPIHPDATPVLLLDERAREQWMNAPVEEALLLQKPPPAGALKVVAVDTKQDVA